MPAHSMLLLQVGFRFLSQYNTVLQYCLMVFSSGSGNRAACSFADGLLGRF